MVSLRGVKSFLICEVAQLHRHAVLHDFEPKPLVKRSVFALLGHDFDIFAVIEQAHETDQPVAVPCGVPPPLPYHYTECACASQVAIQFMSNFSFAYAQNSPVKTQKPPIRTVD